MAVSQSFRDLITNTERWAGHLELRDAYTPDDPEFLRWRAGDLDTSVSVYPDWSQTVAEHVARGMEFRRLRVVSEPVTPFIAFEHAITAATNLAAGERVRWLPRRLALDLATPVADLWVFDGKVVRFTLFSGVGEVGEQPATDDPQVVKTVTDAFDTLWDRGLDHEDYEPTA